VQTLHSSLWRALARFSDDGRRSGSTMLCGEDVAARRFSG
jgi:hypothetical protein